MLCRKAPRSIEQRNRSGENERRHPVDQQIRLELLRAVVRAEPDRAASLDLKPTPSIWFGSQKNVIRSMAIETFLAMMVEWPL